jgi:hypothetical protein
MALATAAYETKLKSIFAAMQDGSKTDAWMAAQVAAATKEYISTGTAVTVDAGTAPAGAYTGAGTGDMTIDSDDLEEDLTQTFESTKLNSYLAAHMADDIDAACSAEGTVETDSIGTASAPPVTSPAAGAGTGSFTGAKAGIAALLILCFETMNPMSVGGDDYFAAQLAAAMNTYLTTGQISVVLLPPLAGAGQGALS